MGGSAISSGTDISADVIEACADPGVNAEKLQEAVQALIAGVGEDVTRDGLKDTPKRVAKAWLDASRGYRQSTRSVVGGALFHEPVVDAACGGLVIVRDIDFASTAETTLLPFYGRCHVGYLPSQGVVLGLSKVARLVTMLAKRLQTQERFTQELLAAFDSEVLSQGCAVIVEAYQLEYGQKATALRTSARRGCFLQEHVMQEFLALLRLSSAGQHSSSGPDAALLPAYCDMDSPRCAAVDGGCLMERAAAVECSSPRTSGLEECMGEAEKEDGCEAVPEALEGAVQTILREIGEDPEREGLRGSAARYVKFLLASTAGYRQGDLWAPVASTSGDASACSNGSQAWRKGLTTAVRLPNDGSARATMQELHLHFLSQCEHHMLPFHGLVHVAYLPGPGGRRLDEAAAATLLKAFSRRLQIQERLTQQLADALHQHAGATSLLVLCEASHMCMVARGVEKHASSTVTTAARGFAQHNAALRSELLLRLSSMAAAER